MPKKKWEKFDDKNAADWEKPKLANKLFRSAADMRRITIAKLLEEDVTYPVQEMIDKFKVSRRQITWDLRYLRSKGNPAAIERLKYYKQMQQTQTKIYEQVEEYISQNPKCVATEIMGALRISRQAVHNATKYLRTHRKNFKFSSEPTLIQKTMRKKKILDYLMMTPNATGLEVSKVLGIPLISVQKIIQDIDSKLNAENMHKREIIKNYCFEELLVAKEKCEAKLAKIKSPVQGARFIELIMQSIKQIAQLYNLGGPESQINVQVNVGKDQRDAAGQAITETLVIKHDLNLPDFTGAGMDTMQ